jgi:hypothetical protein
MTDDHSTIEHDRLNAAFSTKSVLTAERKDLERLLLAAAECKPLSEENTKRNGRRADVLRHLLQVRISEEFQRKNFRISILAFTVSVFALAVAGYRLWQDLSRESAAPPQAPYMQAPSPAKK